MLDKIIAAKLVSRFKFKVFFIKRLFVHDPKAEPYFPHQSIRELKKRMNDDDGFIALFLRVSHLIVQSEKLFLLQSLNDKVIVFEHFLLSVQVQTLDNIIPLVSVGLVALWVIWEQFFKVSLVYKFVVMEKGVVLDKKVQRVAF